MLDINFVDEDYTDKQANNISQWIKKVGKEFSESHQFEQLTHTEKTDSFFLLDVFFGYCYSYCLVGPGKLDKWVVDEMMMDVMPRKISAEKSTFESFAPVMEQFLSWCEEKKHMKDTKNLRDYIQKMSLEMVAKSQDPRYWGMAKSMLMGGTFQDFDIEDEYDADKKEEYFEEAIKPGTVYRQHAKIGRNELCPCGSGKKYKQCCLNSK